MNDIQRTIYVSEYDRVIVTRLIEISGTYLLEKPLYNSDLYEAAYNLKIKSLKGVFLRDNLPKRIRKNESGIFNLDDSNPLDDFGTKSTEGTHWVCWFKRGNEKYYFDSAGLQAPLELQKYLGKHEYNTKEVQPRGSVICGHLCLFVLKKLEEGMTLDEAVRDLLE